MRACSNARASPAATWMLGGAIDNVAAASGARIVTADRSVAVPAAKSRSLGILSSLSFQSLRQITLRGALPDIGTTPQSKPGNTCFRPIAATICAISDKPRDDLEWAGRCRIVMSLPNALALRHPLLPCSREGLWLSGRAASHRRVPHHGSARQ